MRQDDHGLLEPGMTVRVGPKLLCAELYGGWDPEEYEKWLGEEVTVKSIVHSDYYYVAIEEDGSEFLMEEIECIVDENDAFIEEGDMSLDELLRKGS